MMFSNTAFCIRRLSCLSILLLLVVCYAKAQYDDVRCKCVCPLVPKPDAKTNITQQSQQNRRKVYVRSFHEPSMCKCEAVVDEWVQRSSVGFCDRCECQWQRRNTTAIKVVVIFIICTVTLLVLYMLFLLCLDLFLSRRPKSYVEQRNEEVAMHVVRPQDPGHVVSPRLQSSSPDEAEMRAPPGVISRVKTEVRRVHGEAQRWRGTVQEQRKHIYDRHTMLN